MKRQNPKLNKHRRLGLIASAFMRRPQEMKSHLAQVDQYLEDFPECEEGLLMKSRLLSIAGKIRMAQSVLKKLVKLNPQFAPAYSDLVELSMQQGETETAFKSLVTYAKVQSYKISSETFTMLEVFRRPTKQKLTKLMVKVFAKAIVGKELPKALKELSGELKPLKRLRPVECLTAETILRIDDFQRRSAAVRLNVKENKVRK